MNTRSSSNKCMLSTGHVPDASLRASQLTPDAAQDAASQLLVFTGDFVQGTALPLDQFNLVTLDSASVRGCL